MLQGLHAAHEARDERGQPLSVVHRDVSPQNVLVGVDGVTRVLDFGVAKAAARVQVTRDGQMKGKLSYMAPEQLSGKPVDRRVDIFAAGVVLWEALTGRRLFDAEEAAEVLRMIMADDIPPPSAVVPSISREIDAVVMKALVRDSAGRHPTAREFAIALERVMPFSSTREVGEWVERVAGETLENRENVVAEIEAISSVTDVSLVTESSPGFSKTLDEHAPSIRELANQFEASATRKQGARSQTNEAATRLHAPARPPLSPPSRPGVPPPSRPVAPPLSRPSAPPLSRPGAPPPSRPLSAPPPRGTSGHPTVRAPLKSSPGATKIGLPGPASVKPAPSTKMGLPSASPKSKPRALVPGSFDDPREKTKVDRADPSALEDVDEKTIIFDGDRHDAEEADEKTNIFDPARHDLEEADEKTNIFDPARHDLEDADEKTTIHAEGQPISALPTRPTNRIPPPPSQPRTDMPALPQVAPSAPATIVVQETTDPALRRLRVSPVNRAIEWLVADPSKRTFRIALVAGAFAMLSAFGVVAGRGKPKPPARPATVAVDSPAEAPLPAPTPSAAPPEEPVARGIDPSTLPPAPPDEADEPNAPARAAGAGKTVQPAAAEPAPPPEDVKPATPVVESDGTETRKASPKPSPKPVALPAEKPAPVASPKPVAAEAPKEALAPKPAAASKPAADCSNPFTVDANGIKRIKPECL
jgi:serine/threonine protein kinase